MPLVQLNALDYTAVVGLYLQLWEYVMVHDELCPDQPLRSCPQLPWGERRPAAGGPQLGSLLQGLADPVVIIAVH